ncbi:MAG TPA: hypothetical protein VMI30_05140 [Stellaceae bacterium]|nr:hypothetical protein [Stellaceae bacterium]
MPDTHQIHLAAPSIAELHAKWAALSEEILGIESAVDEALIRTEAQAWPMMTCEELRYFPETIQAQLDGLHRQLATREVTRRIAELEARLAAIVNNPAAFEPMQRRATEAYEAREQAFLEMAAKHSLTPQIERHRYATAELDDIEDAMWTTAPRSVRDIAALLDLALRRADDMPVPEHLEKDWPYFCLLTRRLHALVPDFDFSWLRHLSTADHDVTAQVLDEEMASAAE